MKKMMKAMAMAAVLVAAAAGSALATPSTQIWIPSTDIQAFKTVHLGIDSYIRVANDPNYGNNKAPNIYDLGLTFGVLPFELIQLEVGVDYVVNGTSYDNTPVYFNWKLGTPEDGLFKYMPAVAIGMYNMGTNNLTNQNLLYGLVAKNLPVIGRLSIGGYTGSEHVLGKNQNTGLLASWDRTMSEISDKLWMAVDYMSGNNFNGALSFGASWAFTKNVSLLVGFDIWNEAKTGGKNTFTTQLDINLP
jgi:hypothetical protein